MNGMLCKRLKMLRKEEGKLQQDMARLLNVNRSTYGAYELGRITPPAEKLQILAEHFGVSVDYLLGKTNTRELHETETDVADASKIISKLIRQLSDDKNSIDMDGKTMSEDERELLSDSLKNTMKVIKLIQKGKL